MKKQLFRIFGVVASLLTPVLISSVAHAANFTWTGGGTPDGSGNLLFSDASNWDSAPATDGSAVLVFPKDKQSPKVYNDLPANTTFAGLNFSVDGSATPGSANCPSTQSYKVSGNSIALAGNITGVLSVAGTSCYMSTNLVLDITLSTDVAINTVDSVTVNIGATSGTHNTLAMSTHNLSITAGNLEIYSDITGSGTINIGGAGASLGLRGANTTYSGWIDLASGAAVTAYGHAVLGTNASGTTVDSGATLSLCSTTNPEVYDEPLSLAGKGISPNFFGALIASSSCGGIGGGGGGAYTPSNIELTGAVTLTANTEVFAADNIKISGGLSGSFTITSQSGSYGSLNISSSSNTSGTPNGTQAVQIVTTTYSTETTDPLSVGQNDIAVITGKRGNTDVTGTLKGTGTVGDLNIYAGAHLAPGMSPGCIASGNLVLSGMYDVELQDIVACTKHDQTKVTGTVDLTGGTLNIIRFGGMVPRLNNKFIIIDNNGTDAVTGTFSGLAQGATTTVDGITYTVSYTGGDGNDVVLTVTAVASSLGAPNTGFAQLLKSGAILPIFAAVSGLSILAVQAVSKRKK